MTTTIVYLLCVGTSATIMWLVGTQPTTNELFLVFLCVAGWPVERRR